MIELQDDKLVFRFPEVHTDACAGSSSSARCASRMTTGVWPAARPRPVPRSPCGRPSRHVTGIVGRARRRLPAHVSGGSDVAQLRHRLSDGHQGSGGENRRPDGRKLDKRAVPSAAELPDGAQSAVAGRLLCREGDDPPVRRHAAGAGLHGRGAVDRHGGARRVADHRVSHAGRALRGLGEETGRTRRADGRVRPCRRRHHPEMGLAPGGLMRQKIYRDKYGFETWVRSARSRCFVHIFNSEQYLQASGAAPPSMPPTAKDYTDAGCPGSTTTVATSPHSTVRRS